MARSTLDLVTRFFADLNDGKPDAAIFTPDWVVWTLSTGADTPGPSDLEANKLLLSLFPDGLRYDVHSVIVDGDRAAARASARGVLENGGEYRNDYVFLFEIRDGRIARIEEFFDTKAVEKDLLPLLMKAMGQS